jgi:peptidoglycan/xylan/chitin deacetylase (PgdA/CDA1 family)
MDEYRDLDEIVEGIAAIVFDTGYGFAPLAKLYANQYEVKPLTEIEGWDLVKVNKVYDPDASIKARSLSRIHVKDKVMFLTFDDWGGDKQITRILDTLEKYGVKASFFLRGAGVINNPNLARAISEAGHDVANHTYTHSIINSLTVDELQEDVVKCQQVVAEAIGRAPEPYFRPPTLTYDTPTTNAVLACGMEYSLLSNISTQDYERSAKEVIKYTIENAKQGEMVVLHLTDNSSSADALPTIIEKLTAMGYKLDKLSNYLPKPE